jgi:hypothetical protein
MQYVVFFLSIFMCIGAGTAYAGTNVPYVVDANTIALYHFDESTLGVTPDAVGNHPGTLNGNAAISSGGKFGNGLLLDGSGDFVRLGNVHQDPVKITWQGTVEAWVKLSSALPPTFAVLASGREYGGYWDDGWFLGRWATTGSPNLSFMIWKEGFGMQVADSGIAASELVGGWHHLAGTWGPAGVQVWVDGVLKNTNFNYTSGLPNPGYQTALVGAESNGNCTPGMIDEVRISDIQRSFQALRLPSAVLLLLLDD